MITLDMEETAKIVTELTIDALRAGRVRYGMISGKSPTRYFVELMRAEHPDDKELSTYQILRFYHAYCEDRVREIAGAQHG